MQAGRFLRKATDGHAHWCPGCKEMHHIPSSWGFDGDLEKPTFTPSVRISGKQCVLVDGEWTGEWVRGADGKALDGCCHYNLTAGQLHFHPDSTHALAGSIVALPDLPAGHRD